MAKVWNWMRRMLWIFDIRLPPREPLSLRLRIDQHDQEIREIEERLDVAEEELARLCDDPPTHPRGSL